MKNAVKTLGERNHPQREDAFTMTELLAVLATIGLFAALLLPAFAAATDHASRTVCVNNLRQLGTAALMYPSDNRDYFAYPNWDVQLSGWLFTPTSQGDIPSSYTRGLWFPYVQNTKVYLCPVDTWSKYYKLRLNQLSSYSMNGAVCGYGFSQNDITCKITEIWNPGCYLLWGPDENAGGTGSPGPFSFNDAAIYPDRNEGPEHLHTAIGTDVLTVRGNVQFVSTQRYKSEQSSPARSLVWWNPFSGNGH